LAEEVARPRFGRRVALWRRIGNPEIELEAAVALAAEIARPGFDAVGLRQQCAHAAHAAGIRDGGGECDGAGAGHRRL
jgi:hypothetical protein